MGGLSLPKGVDIPLESAPMSVISLYDPFITVFVQKDVQIVYDKFTPFLLSTTLNSKLRLDQPVDGQQVMTRFVKS